MSKSCRSRTFLFVTAVVTVVGPAAADTTSQTNLSQDSASVNVGFRAPEFR